MSIRVESEISGYASLWGRMFFRFIFLLFIFDNCEKGDPNDCATIRIKKNSFLYSKSQTWSPRATADRDHSATLCYNRGGFAS